MRGFFGKRILAVFIVALAVSLWVLMSAPLAQTSKAEKPVVQKAAPLKLEKPKDQKAIPLNKPAIPPATEVEIQRRFNELKRELLDDRADSIEWWLAVVAIVLTFFGIVVAIGGFFGIRIFRDIVNDARDSAKEAKQIVADAQKSAEAADQVATDARKSAEDAKELVEEIKGYREESQKVLRKMTAESVADDPEKAKQVVKDVFENPQSSPMDKVVARALSLQEQDKKDEAIEIWRSIANVMEGIDDDLAARGWFSIGYLLSGQGKHEEAISAYDEALRLQPDHAVFYNNRGNAKSNLGQHEAALGDYNEALRLKPDFAEAYNNRGNVKSILRRHEAAIVDFDEALRLKPDYAEAYNNRGSTKGQLGQLEAALSNFDDALRLKPDYAEAYIGRGITKVIMGFVDNAREDFTTALDLASKVGDENLITLAEQELQKLDEK